MKGQYDDIIDLPHHVSARHPKMPMPERAAQFSPFMALTGYEDVIPQIDAYDAAQSDTANYMTDLNEATLVITGDLNLQKYTVKEMIEMKKANLLLLSSGINPDGSREQTDAKYVYKQYDVTGAEAYKDRLYQWYRI